VTRAITRALFVTALALGGCYDPSIREGQYSCSSTSFYCPGGLTCDPCTFLCVYASHACNAGDGGTSFDGAGGGGDGDCPNCGPCAAGMHLCNGNCVSNQSVDSCGSSCSPCPAPPANAASTCDGTSCGFRCDAAYEKSATGCVQLAFVQQTKNYAYGLWASGPSDIYAPSANSVLHSTGDGNWSPQYLPYYAGCIGSSGSGGTVGPAVWGSDSTNVYTYSWCTVSTGNAAYQIYSSTGDGHWTSQPGGLVEVLGLWGSASDDIYAISAGAMAYSNGTGSWRSVNGPGGNGIWGSSKYDIYVVSDSIQHYDGKGWSAQSSGTNNSLIAVWGSGADNVYAVGEGGTILRSSGNGTWSAEVSGTMFDLYSVHGSGADDVWAVGLGVVVHSNGDGKWTTIPLGSTTTQHAVFAISPTNVYVVGNDGIFHLQ
jgi:hypothetical protein